MNIRKTRQEEAKKSEDIFTEFCRHNGIECLKLDNNDGATKRKNFLIREKGKCPDFWCRKNNQEIFIEVKTLTNITNPKRQKMIGEMEKVSEGNSLVFNPIPELRKPIEQMLKDAGEKFKNINSKYDYPKILVLYGIVIPDVHFVVHSIFYGAYDSYKLTGNKLKPNGLRKIHKGLFDVRGSNVSAILFWDKGIRCFCGIENPNAKIKFPEELFYSFFKKSKI